MLVKKIKYEDFRGETREDEFLFNMNKAEVFMWLTCNGGYTLDELLRKLQKDARGKDIMQIFESLILQAYGEISVDGLRFEKSEELSKKFKETNAYAELFVELVTDAKKAGEFITEIIPKNIADEIDKIIDENPDAIPDEMKDYLKGKTPAPITAMPGA